MRCSAPHGWNSTPPDCFFILYGPFLILLGLIGWAIGLFVLLILMRMAGTEDRAARHAQKRLDPFPTSRSPSGASALERTDPVPAMSDCADRHPSR